MKSKAPKLSAETLANLAAIRRKLQPKTKVNVLRTLAYRGQPEPDPKLVVIAQKDPLPEGGRHHWLCVSTQEMARVARLRFIAGQRSHGNVDIGTVATMELFNELERELIDAMMYLAEIRRRIKE